MPNINVQLKNAGGEILYPQTDGNLVQNKPSYKIGVTSFDSGPSITGKGQGIKIGRFTVKANNPKYPLSFLVNTPTSRDFITLQGTNVSLAAVDMLYASYRNLIQGSERKYVYERVSNVIYDLYIHVWSYEQIMISDLYRPIWDGSISYEGIWEHATPASPINLKRFLDYKTASAENINTIFTN